MDEKLKSHFLSLYCMIVADGDVALSELNEMYRIARENYGISQEEINRAVLSGGSAFYIPEQNCEKIKYLYDLALIASADGVIEESEIVLLRNYAISNRPKKADLILEFKSAFFRTVTLKEVDLYPVKFQTLIWRLFL